jgi:NADH-quinone oxidoreductase subunit F
MPHSTLHVLLIRLGAEKVTVIYRRSQDEMPAYVEEIDEALQEGITLMPLTNPEEILTENGKVVGMKCTPMKLGDFDRSGRRSTN